MVTVSSGVGAESDHFLDKSETRFEYVLGDHRRAFGNRRQTDCHRLQVGRESGVRQCCEIDRFRPFTLNDAETVNLGSHLRAGRPKLVEDQSEMLVVHPANADVTPGHGGSDTPCCGNDPVTDDAVNSRFQLADALNGERRTSAARYLGAHLVEHVAQIHDLGLTCSVVDHCLTTGEDRCHQDVLGCTHRREDQADVRSMQVVCLGNYTSVFDLAARTQQAEPGLVHVEGPRTDGVTSRQGNNSASTTRDQRTENTHRRSELFHRIEVSVILRLGRRRDPHFGIFEFDFAAQTSQNVRHQRYVENVRAVGHDSGAFGQQRRGHQLQHTVLGPSHQYFTFEAVTPGHKKVLTHGSQPRATTSSAPRRYRSPMSVHLTKIYTRTGDDGTTGLSDFSRVSKNDPRLIAYADCDETNAAIGVAVALGTPPENLLAMLRQIQNDLFDAGADLSTPVVENPKYPPLRVTQSYIDRLEGWCDELNEQLAPLNSFILPGGTALGALLHVARTVSRRAERAAWSAIDANPEDTSVLPAKYLNRLSDLLFIMGRVANPEGDVLWKPGAGA